MLAGLLGHRKKGKFLPLGGLSEEMPLLDRSERKRSRNLKLAFVNGKLSTKLFAAGEQWADVKSRWLFFRTKKKLAEFSN